MPQNAIRVLAGDCTVRFEGDDVREERGNVVVIGKPDGTILVHDRDGYRPVAWLTRADSVSWADANGTAAVEAASGDRRLTVACHAEYGGGRFATTAAGAVVGDCPDCHGTLVRAADSVECLGCGARYGVPTDADLLDADCGTCGLPRMRVARGDAFDVCLDRACDPLDEAVRDRFDRAWSCPTCGDDLRVLRRGTLIAGCDSYPACETAFRIPAGTIAGDCDRCGLPIFETRSGRRCLDATCSR